MQHWTPHSHHFYPFFCFIPSQSKCNRCRSVLFHHVAIYAYKFFTLNRGLITCYYSVTNKYHSAVGMYSLWLMPGTLHLNTPFPQRKDRRPYTVRGKWCCAHPISHRLVTANEYLIPDSDGPRWQPACSLRKSTTWYLNQENKIMRRTMILVEKLITIYRRGTR
jgi:hypothetical protein